MVSDRQSEDESICRFDAAYAWDEAPDKGGLWSRICGLERAIFRVPEQAYYTQRRQKLLPPQKGTDGGTQHWFYLPYLFTFLCSKCAGMPNTNNKIEGTFTDLKKSLNNHTGMSLQNRKRFISGFFLQRLNWWSFIFLLSTNDVFRLLRGSPSRILRNPQQRDF